MSWPSFDMKKIMLLSLIVPVVLSCRSATTQSTSLSGNPARSHLIWTDCSDVVSKKLTIFLL